MITKESIYNVRELEPGLYRIGNSAVFMDLIVGSHHALLFDTGYGYGDLKAVVRSITDKPLYVVNSHGHVDHACGRTCLLAEKEYRQKKGSLNSSILRSDKTAHLFSHTNVFAVLHSETVFLAARQTARLFPA